MAKAIFRSVDLRQQVYENLRARITGGEFDKDTRFYERTFADELGVSRTPVREALAMLEQDGLLSPAARGYHLPKVSRQQVIDITEIRLLLEPHAMATLVRDTEPAELKKIAEKIRHVVQNTCNSDAYISSHEQMRAMIYSNLRNAALVAAIQLYEDAIHFVRVSTLGRPCARRLSADGMLDLADSLANCDAEKASQVQAQLLIKARDSFLEHTDGID